MLNRPKVTRSPCCEPHVFFGGCFFLSTTSIGNHPSITHRNEYLAFWRTSLRVIISPGRTTSMPTRSWCDSWPIFYWRPSDLKGEMQRIRQKMVTFFKHSKKAVNFRSSIFWDTKNAVERFGRRFCLWIFWCELSVLPWWFSERKREVNEQRSCYRFLKSYSLTFFQIQVVCLRAMFIFP